LIIEDKYAAIRPDEQYGMAIICRVAYHREGQIFNCYARFDEHFPLQ
jgi:hypothetical protein